MAKSLDSQCLQIIILALIVATFCPFCQRFLAIGPVIYVCWHLDCTPGKLAEYVASCRERVLWPLNPINTIMLFGVMTLDLPYSNISASVDLANMNLVGKFSRIVVALWYTGGASS